MLTTEQQAAVDMVTRDQPRICCLTGGPGTGKTYTIKTICQELRRQSRSFRLCAPSGKAALRMQESTDEEASTVHRMLYLKPGSDDAEPVHADVVIVDESSMVDAELMATLVKACGLDPLHDAGGTVQTLLLVGDANQLPPVGAGQPFHDMLKTCSDCGLGVVPSVRLTQIQRQAADSGIVQAAHAIVAGRCPDWTHDFRLVVEEDAKAIPSRVWEVLNAGGMTPDDSQILAPQKNGPGVHAINDFVEEQRDGGELLRGKFRQGTKVIATKNDYQRQVFNGELGYVHRVQPGPDGKQGKDELVAGIGGGEHLYRGGAIKDLLPAWALTVHKSQGSEWKNVVFVAHPSHTHMLTRSLLYVAITRARQEVVVVGTEQAVERAVRRVEDTSRRTNLQRWNERHLRAKCPCKQKKAS